MTILTQTISSQLVNFIPRSDEYNVYELIDEQTNETVTITPIDVYVGEYYHTLEAEFNLVENHFYILNIINSDTSEIVFKDRIFCTNQNIVTFSVNNGQYTSTSSNNDFIIYE